MKPKGSPLQAKVGTRNRRQRARARELREQANRDRYVKQLAAQERIKRSREKIRKQVERTTLRARQARVKAVRAGDRSRKRAKAARDRARHANSGRRG
jgi:hypothetical protein